MFVIIHSVKNGNMLVYSPIYKKLWDRTIKENDLLPVGAWGALPVVIRQPRSEYPHVVRLDFQFSSEKLTADFHSAKLKLGKTANLLDILKPHFIGTDNEEVYSMLQELGFTRDKYATYSLRKPHSIELSEHIGQYTRESLDAIGPHFRELYTIAKPGWSCKPHIDNINMERHGFKVHLPINVDAFIGYLVNEEVVIYRLEKGVPYFCNTSIMHFGLNVETEDRYAINYHLATDDPICKGHIMDPIETSDEIQNCLNWLQPQSS